jgi:hypothetical protein
MCINILYGVGWNKIKGKYMTTQEKGRKYEQGVTQAAIFRLIIRGGGSETEPRIREYLRKHLDIRSERGVRTHLQNMEGSKIICKHRNPEHSNTWLLDESSLECYEYLCDLILQSQFESDIKIDISRYFQTFGDLSSSQRYNLFTRHPKSPIDNITYNIIRGFADKGQREEGDFKRAYAHLESDEEMLKIIYIIAVCSPTLFSLGSEKYNSIFSILVRVLMDGEKYPEDCSQSFYRWVVAHVILAAYITDYRIYRLAPFYYGYFEEIHRLWANCHLYDAVEKHLPNGVGVRIG